MRRDHVIARAVDDDVGLHPARHRELGRAPRDRDHRCGTGEPRELGVQEPRRPLPQHDDRIAGTDVGALLPVAFCLYTSVRVYEGGGRRYFVAAGAMAGLAVGFKYTAGLVVCDRR